MMVCQLLLRGVHVFRSRGASSMKYDLILAGVGGQGILSIAAIIGRAIVDGGLHLKQSEVHGMAQRGGAVQAHVRISDTEIFSDLIPAGGADMILAVEPMEALRYVSLLREEGWIIANETPMVNIGNYPDSACVYEQISAMKHHRLLNADMIAKDAGSARSMNVAMLGAASAFIDGIEEHAFEKAIACQFAHKGQDVIDINVAVFRAGRQCAGAKTK